MNVITWLLIGFSVTLVYKLSYLDFVPVHDTNFKFEVYRDQQGIAHIYGSNLEDIFFGLGFTQASDRLWTLYLRKMMAYGRLCQLFGELALQSDLYMRNLRLGKVGYNNSNHVLKDQKTMKLFNAYINGINTYASKVKMLPFQFYLLGVQWQQWIQQDSQVLLAFMSFCLQFDWMYQIARQRLMDLTGFELGRKLLGFGSDTNFRFKTIMTDKQLKQKQLFDPYDPKKQIQILKQHWQSKKMKFEQFKKPFTTINQGSGSNSWVIGGKHTIDGKPILANDPHLGSLIPSFFYPVQLVLLKENKQVQIQVFGAMIDGMPSISVGVNGFAAWGSTASYIDNKDIFYQTTRVLSNGTVQYYYLNQWVNFIEQVETFNVKGMSEPFIKKYYINHRGPILQTIFKGLRLKYGYPLPQDYHGSALVLQSALYDQDFTTIRGLISISFAKTTEQLFFHGKFINGPNLDTTFITSNGTYGYHSIGRIPLRQIPQMGSFIKDGKSDIYDMKGYLPKQNHPSLKNPTRGYISMCNNKFASDNYKGRFSLNQVTTGRSYRIDKLINDQINIHKKFTLQDVIAQQLDNRDQFLSQALPHVLAALSKVKYLWINTTKNHQNALKLYDVLLKWDYHMSSQSKQTAIYHVWQRLFHSSLFKNITKLNNQQRQALINHAFFQNYVLKLYQKMDKQQQLGQQQQIICENPQYPKIDNVHACVIAAAMAFKQLPEQLYRLFGSKDIQDYQWGKIHRMKYKSIPWSDAGLDFIFGRSHPAGGNSRTLNVAILTHQLGDYNGFVNPTFRIVTNLDKTYYLYDTGVTDRIISPYYSNFVGSNTYLQYIRYNAHQKMPKNWRKTV